jgi:hypothetical protein
VMAMGTLKPVMLVVLHGWDESERCTIGDRDWYCQWAAYSTRGTAYYQKSPYQEE